MEILIIDNYDSFVYNIVGLMRDVAKRPGMESLAWRVVRNDVATDEDVESCDAIVLSPGPGLPSEAGRMMELLGRYAGKRPIFGVCLGFQAIACHFGATLRNLPMPRHGHRSELRAIDERDPIVGMLAAAAPVVGRYHSWVVDRGSLPECLVATSEDEDGNIMSLRHVELPIFGTQFHPESMISDCGLRIMENFLRLSL